MNIFDRIPEDDKVCINCHYFGRIVFDAGDKEKCGTCRNYHRDGTEDCFKPDDIYLQMEFGCEACSQYVDGDFSEQCHECSRYYSDYWERVTE